VVDANVVVSATLSPDGTPRRALAVARSRGTIALSENVFREIANVLSRPKFAGIIGDERREELLELLSVAALWVEPAEPVHDCRDPKDNCYLELALASRASCIISGDQDLLVLHPWRGVRILNANAFLDLIG
jgi:putative PIN family toxin of toxin-antitoxin system